jgi:hypothetical protein
VAGSASEVIDMRLLICTIAALAIASFFAAGAGADPAATPVATGCPAGFSLFAVPAPGTSPYRLPARLDNPANGGNGDGFVCALRLPEAVVAAYCNHHEPGACQLLQLGLPLYQFTEDTNPARGATEAVPDFGS